MTIHNQVQEIGLPHVRNPDALCCTFVTGILPQSGNPPAGDEPATTPERLAPAAPVEPSNRPTTVDTNACETGRPADAHEVGQAASPPPAANNEHPDPDIAHFYAEFRRGLPDEYCFNEEEQVIFEPLKYQWVCGPIRVASYPRRVDGSGWCVHVEYLDRDGRLRRHTFPQIELNTGKGKHIADLIDRGLAVYAEPFWTTRVLSAWEGVPHGWRVDAAGWFTDPDGMSSFVRADGRAHQPASADVAPVVHASPATHRPALSGSLEGWQEDVAAQALGNPALIFAISAAFAGPLLRWSGIDTAGFNMFGPSGIGKSLLLRLALSCGNAPSALMPWSAAQTGLHRLSAQSQDGLLALDAFRRDPDTRHLKALLAIGDDAASGRILPARDPDGGERWRRLLLSTSELPLSAVLRRKQKGVPAALSTRIVDIREFATGQGLVAQLHGASDSRQFARRLEASMQRHHGHLLGLFLDRLVNDLAGIRARLDGRIPELTRHLQEHCHAHAPGSPACQPAIAERFALVAFVGELAVSFGLLPWPAGSAREAALQMAGLAHNGCPTDGWNSASALVEIRGFIDRHAGRIIDLEAGPEPESDADPVGWQDREHIYLRSEPVREELDDLDTMLAAIDDILVPGGEARSRQYRMPASKVADRPRVYRLAKAGLD